MIWTTPILPLKIVACHFLWVHLGFLKVCAWRVSVLCVDYLKSIGMTFGGLSIACTTVLGHSRATSRTWLHLPGLPAFQCATMKSWDGPGYEASYCSVPGKCPLLGKLPYTKFQGINVAASIIYIFWVSTHAGQNCELCLNAYGHLPRKLGSYDCAYLVSQ